MFCYCMSLHVCPGVILEGRLAIFFRKKLSFWLFAYSVLIVVPLLIVRPSFPSMS